MMNLRERDAQTPSSNSKSFPWLISKLAAEFVVGKYSGCHVSCRLACVAPCSILDGIAAAQRAGNNDEAAVATVLTA